MREHTTHTYILSVMQRSCKAMFGSPLQEDVSGPGSERHNFYISYIGWKRYLCSRKPMCSFTILCENVFMVAQYMTQVMLVISEMSSTHCFLRTENPNICHEL